MTKAEITGRLPISRESASNIGNSATARMADQMTISAKGAISSRVNRQKPDNAQPDQIADPRFY